MLGRGLTRWSAVGDGLQPTRAVVAVDLIDGVSGPVPSKCIFRPPNPPPPKKVMAKLFRSMRSINPHTQD